MTALSREHILAEIRRTAADNGGLPLGRSRFYDETGIRETDWSGRYWSKWSDAIAEAGLTPNQMNQALSLDDVVRSYALYVRELGRLPVIAELKMRRRQDPAFPSHNTFNRLGSRAQRAKAVLDFSERHEGFNDVAEICQPVAAGAEDKSSPAPSGAPEQFGFVYLMKSGKYYKIGRSVCAEKRAYEVRLVLPEELVLMHKIKTDDPEGIEAYWHHRFKDRRVRGEWFDLGADDVKAFRRRRFM